MLRGDPLQSSLQEIRRCCRALEGSWVDVWFWAAGVSGVMVPSALPLGEQLCCLFLSELSGWSPACSPCLISCGSGPFPSYPQVHPYVSILHWLRAASHFNLAPSFPLLQGHLFHSPVLVVVIGVCLHPACHSLGKYHGGNPVQEK